MSFKRGKSTLDKCQYVARYSCSCNGGASPVIVDVTIRDHKTLEKTALYLFGAYHDDGRDSLKFCPTCGTEVPLSDAILTLEMLRHHEPHVDNDE